MSAPAVVTDARSAAEALADLMHNPPAWLPDVDHWEVARDEGDTWSISGQVVAETTGQALRALAAVSVSNSTPMEDDGITARARFAWAGAPVDVWWVRPNAWRTVPERCATCPTPLGAGTAHVWLGTGPDAPVICVPCQDRMHAAWTAGTATRLMVYLPECDTIRLDYYLAEADARRHCEDLVRDEYPPGTRLEFTWLGEDEDDPEAPRELVVRVNGGEERPTLYVVTPLPVAAVYNPETTPGGEG
ncbi:MAG TPA: hypothetical protein VK545_10195 [Streptomyces sp.]|nr:hypothetical protein [Streptomyces sp.]